jgi:hypothetical protein
VDAVRARLVATAGSPDPSASSLAEVARRLVAIDPDRAGIGGLRLQLELALFAAPGSGAPRASVPPTAEPVLRPTESVPPTAEPGAPEAEPVGSSAGSSVPEPIAVSSPAPAAPAAAGRSGPDAGAAAPPATTPGELTLDAVVAAWPAIVAHLSQKPAIKQLILTCRPVTIDGAIVSLGFPEEQAFLRDVAERKRADIEAGIAHVVGRDVGVRCVVANVELPAQQPPGDEGYLMAEARRIFGEDLVDVGEVS